MDEVAAKERDEESGAEAKPTRKAAVRLYSDGAVADRQPRVTDLVPTRWLSLTLLSAFLILAPAALMGLGHQMHARGYVQNASALASLDLTQRGNVAEWFTSLMLAGGSLLALAIFSIRRHRTDDYQGQYRLWLLVAVACLGASLDAATHIREVFGLVVSRLSGQVILGRSTGWCLLGYGLFAGGLTVRVAFEIYRSKAASFLLTLTVLIYATLAATMAGVSFSDDPLTALVIRTSLIFAGASSLVLTLVGYARFVHREAQGITAAKRKKPKTEEAKKKTKAEDDKPSDDSKSDAKPATSAKPGPLAGKGPIKPAVQDDDDEEDEEEDDDRGGMGGRLSKSERKRLKRLQSQPQPTRRAA
jgi:hypothetical protein